MFSHSPYNNNNALCSFVAMLAVFSTAHVPLVLPHIASCCSTSFTLECSYTTTATTYCDNSDDGLWRVWALGLETFGKKKTSKVGEWGRYGGIKKFKV
jgi:hypothetical protein